MRTVKKKIRQEIAPFEALNRNETLVLQLFEVIEKTNPLFLSKEELDRHFARVGVQSQADQVFELCVPFIQQEQGISAGQFVAFFVQALTGMNPAQVHKAMGRLMEVYRKGFIERWHATGGEKPLTQQEYMPDCIGLEAVPVVVDKPGPPNPLRMKIGLEQRSSSTSLNWGSMGWDDATPPSESPRSARAITPTPPYPRARDARKGCLLEQQKKTQAPSPSPRNMRGNVLVDVTVQDNSVTVVFVNSVPASEAPSEAPSEVPSDDDEGAVCPTKSAASALPSAITKLSVGEHSLGKDCIVVEPEAHDANMAAYTILQRGGVRGS